MGHFITGERETMDLGPGLAAASCPVLVVGGEADPVCPIEMSDEIVAALSNATVTYERLPGASRGASAGSPATPSGHSSPADGARVPRRVLMPHGVL